jgi:predicted TIM-barrel fold metal-dependent hydrolase
MPTESSTTSPEPDAAAPALVVDHQVHWYPPSAVEQLMGRSTYPKMERDADGGYVLWLDEGVSQPLMDRLAVDVEEHLAHAAEAGVDVLVIGPATMGEVFHLPAPEAADLLDHVHVEYAAAQRAHPDRLACLAALPMQEPSAALEVLDRAIGQLGLRGVSLLTTTVDREHPLVTEGSLAVFARIAELGVPLFLHPGFRSTTRLSTRTFREEAGLSWTYQTALTALELVVEGVLDAVPDLVVVHPHLGGVLPYVAERISPLGGSKARHPLEHYLKTRFYVDTAAGNPGALRLAIETYGIERVVFATDYPFYAMSSVRRWVENSAGPQAARQIYANRVPGLRLPTPAATRV